MLRRFLSYSLGKPTKSLVPPGNCILTENWTPLALISKETVNHDTSVYRFSLPDGTSPLNLSTCACVLASIPDSTANGELIVRPYTPISTNADIGFMDLMVKKYRKGIMSTALSNLNAGDTLDFKHISFNVKVQAPFNVKKIGMLVGGTGVAPMIQALHAILGAHDNTTEVTLLYGSKTQQDILAREQIEAWAKASGGKFVVHHVLSEEPSESDWEGRRGFIDEEMIRETLPPSDDGESCIFVCGPPAMYDSICGDRTEKEVLGILEKIGYSQNVVYKF
jgi:cytochrome-b5 reductase